MTLDARRCGGLVIAAFAAVLCIGSIEVGSCPAAVAGEPSSEMSADGVLEDAKRELRAEIERVTDEELKAANLCTSAEEKEDGAAAKCDEKREASAEKRLDAIDLDSDHRPSTHPAPYEMRNDVGVAPQTRGSAEAAARDVCVYMVQHGGAYCGSCDKASKYLDWCKVVTGRSFESGTSKHDDHNLGALELDVKAAAYLAFEEDKKGDASVRTKADKAEAYAVHMWEQIGWPKEGHVGRSEE
ncbi:hypothetical protein ACFYO1_01130 [Nocardia sp. NPDC006044]|uniref:hypothetical protein n=1 Tax=Nocardia sp. NPDC006044 TaxID=3364306 RepID=UPI0036C5A1EE